MATDRGQFIERLVAEHRPRAVLPLPGWRALRWFLAALAANAAVLWLVQPFRPGFAGQLAEHPRLLAEVGAALLAVAAGAYVFLVRSVPGERVTRAVGAGLAGIVAVLALSLVAGLVWTSPDFGTSGARRGCWIEGLVFGAATLASLVALVSRACPRISRRGMAVMGGLAGLLPAALMHVACMYNPGHALVYHYGPVAVLVIVAAILPRPSGAGDRRG
jgi:hypothetical protein